MIAASRLKLALNSPTPLPHSITNHVPPHPHPNPPPSRPWHFTYHPLLHLPHPIPNPIPPTPAPQPYPTRHFTYHPTPARTLPRMCVMCAVGGRLEPRTFRVVRVCGLPPRLRRTPTRASRVGRQSLRAVSADQRFRRACRQNAAGVKPEDSFMSTKCRRGKAKRYFYVDKIPAG